MRPDTAPLPLVGKCGPIFETAGDNRTRRQLRLPIQETCRSASGVEMMHDALLKRSRSQLWRSALVHAANGKFVGFAKGIFQYQFVIFEAKDVQAIDLRLFTAS